LKKAVRRVEGGRDGARRPPPRSRSRPVMSPKRPPRGLQERDCERRREISRRQRA